tara:strand:+ start:72089 stop:72565 length:477 start_codon:yes stop_codon:yes gene_type:complete
MTTRTRHIVAILTCCLLASYPGIFPFEQNRSAVHAAAAPSASDDPAAGMAGLIYYSLGPSFVTNYDGAGRLKYLKADVSVRIEPGTAQYLQRHLPYIRNRLIVLFSSQLEENLTSTEGKEVLRRQAMDEVKSALLLLESQEVADRVMNLYFTSFVVQN